MKKISKFDNDLFPESWREGVEIVEKVHDDVSNILERQDKIRRATELPTIISKAYTSPIYEPAMKVAFQTYQLDSPAIRAIEAWENSDIALLTQGIAALVNNPAIQEISAVNTSFSKWLETVDFFPLSRLVETSQYNGFKITYEEVKEVLFKAMFHARWFPYAGWLRKNEMFHGMLEILETSRVSNNRIKRIDRLVFSYYDKQEINDFKRKWRSMDLPAYMIRILVQSIQAYNRREYALTVCALLTLWEGIIQEKANEDRGHRVSRKTRENLKKLIEKNEFNNIFSSFCDDFIFYQCNGVEDVKPDVPGRHSIAHCWYNTYPSRKMALNAILFTDFLLILEPLDEAE